MARMMMMQMQHSLAAALQLLWATALLLASQAPLQRA
jgi:hypothetical protein